MKNWSKYQQAVFANVATGKGHTVVKAVAGSGKTTTIVEALSHVPPGLKTLFVAFNKSIAEELAKRAPRTVEVSTLHSYGLKTITRSLGRLKIENNRVYKIIRGTDLEIVRVTIEIQKNLGLKIDPEAELPFDMQRDLARAVSFAKGSLFSEESQVDEIIDTFEIETPKKSPIQGFPLELEMQAAFRAAFVRDVLAILLRCADTSDGQIDFDDMIWLPVVLELNQVKFDRVFVDECLPGPTPILLADGSSRTIQDLVESRYSGDVLAYDPATGEQRPCRVTGWQTILNQKPLVKIKARWSRKKGTNKPTNFVICTKDHKIWADGAWIPAGDVRPGMTLQVETSADKSQVGKITKKGRAKLADEIRRKNSSGVMGGANPTGFSGVRGGNGKGPTVPEQALMNALGDGWMWQHTIPTQKPRGQGYPTAYKVDIAKPGCKIAIEVDGASHRIPGRGANDSKKDQLLESLGWTVIRVPNRRAVQNAQEEADRILAMINCPIDAIVESVEAVTIPSFHVYDLTVEDLHCFYANGILVHNCQDLNPAQIEMTLRSVKTNGRVCAVGDERQAIYKFRGADSAAISNIVKRLDATVLPLSICYRCARSIVKKAQEIVPEIEWAPDAEEGSVQDATMAEMRKNARPGQFILSRANAPLISLCLGFLKEGRPATIQGRDIGASLAAFVKKSAAPSVEALCDYVEKWCEIECDRLAKKHRDTQSVEDRAECILALSEGAMTVQEVIDRIERLFADKDDANRIVLSSTHKAKGMERDTVWLLESTYMRRPGVEEANIFYVGISRARKQLFLVAGDYKKRSNE